jgi:outer membrane protein assembly factor BamB
MPSTDPAENRRRRVRRRRLLQSLGSTALVGLAGCTGTDDQQATGPTPAEQTDTPRSPESSTPSATPDARERPSLNGPWPTVHADSSNTGTVSEPGPEGEPSVRWRGHVSLQTRIRATTGPHGPVATQKNGTVLAYDRGGSLRWRRRHASGFVAAPVVARDGTVVVGRLDGRIVAYAGDGTKRWERTSPEGLFAPNANDATPFRIADDTVVLAHPRGQVAAYSLADGTEEWSVDSPSRLHRPAVADGRVFLTGDRTARGDAGVVLALSLSDGTELWRTQVESPLKIAPSVHDGTVYTADIDGRLTARSAADGNVRWSVRIDDDPWLSTIPVTFGGLVWVGTLSAGVYGLSEAGVQVHVDVAGPTTPAVGDDRLYVGTNESGSESGTGRDGAVLAIDADGTVQWRTATRGVPDAQVRYRDGLVVVGTDTGVVEGLAAKDGTRRWRAFERPARLPSPVVGPATVYCGSHDDHVNGYRVTDGTSHLWHVSFEEAAPRTPAVAGQTVIAGSLGGELAGTPLLEYADEPAGRVTRTPTPDPDATPTPHIDAPAPEPRWRTTLDAPISDVGYGTDAAYLGSGTTVVSMTAGGDVRWETDLGGRVRGSPAVVDDLVCVSTTDGTVRALDTEDGTEKWRRSVGENLTAPALIDSGQASTAVVGTDSAVVALDPETAGERWRTETGHVWGTPAVTSDRVVAGDETGTVRCLDLADGTERWRTETGGAIRGAPAVAGETAYVGSRDGRLYALSLQDGSIDWDLGLPDWVDGSPAVAHGVVFVVDQSGTLSAVVGDQ